MMERSTQSLSGGEKRRVAIALVLGFAELIATWGQLSCNVAVFDEASDYIQVTCPCDWLSPHRRGVDHSGFIFNFGGGPADPADCPNGPLLQMWLEILILPCSAYTLDAICLDCIALH